MKRFGTTALALLLCLSASACASPKLNVLVPVEPRSEAPGVTISRTAHPVTLPLESLAGATFIGSDGEPILYNKHKGLYATVVTNAKLCIRTPVNAIPERLSKNLTY